jgi:hypothetical protein
MQITCRWRNDAQNPRASQLSVSMKHYEENRNYNYKYLSIILGYYCLLWHQKYVQ